MDLAQAEDLKNTTHCCCLAQSFLCDYPKCCGVQMMQQCFCCSNAAGLQCMQLNDDTKVFEHSQSEKKCLDNRGDSLICTESASDIVFCCCIKGATKGWCGTDDFDPVFTQGNILCIDTRCALPPTPETVPMGIACCGVEIWGEQMASTKANPVDTAAQA